MLLFASKQKKGAGNGNNRKASSDGAETIGGVGCSLVM
jgi:hypothetical protein